MALSRRQFLLFLGTATGAAALSSGHRSFSMPFSTLASPAITPQPPGLSFQPIQGPMPLPTDGFSPTQQQQIYQTVAIADDLVLPEGFTYQVIAAWGDPVGDSRFGYNNDYLSFLETGPGAGYLTVNFEYISARPWLETYSQVLNRPPLTETITAVVQAVTTVDLGNGLSMTGINAYALAEADPLKAQIQVLCREALTDQGIGVISLQKTPAGDWIRRSTPADRRITGITGLDDGRHLKVTGAAAAVFRKTRGIGYDDGLGERIIGTFANCAGGTTPWGTVLSAEENFQSQVPEPVYADGTPLDPSHRPFEPTSLRGQGNVFGLAGHKYGWIVEVDPANPEDHGTKHTNLGRYRHEAVGIRVTAGQPLAFYSGCDRQGGHLYKFVSQGIVADPKAPANSKLLEAGILYGARFEPDGTGRWIPLRPDTPVAPDSPQNLSNGLILLPPSQIPGYYLQADSDGTIQDYRQRYRTLGDIYRGNPEEKQGAILIDAHYAGNAAGITCTARPEDTIIGPDGTLFISFTSGTFGRSGGPDNRIFQGPQGEVPYEYGWIMSLTEVDNDPAALAFRWQIVAAGGETQQGGAGFANPDNLAVDGSGHLWIVTDISSGAQNRATPQRSDGLDIRGCFGNNALWFLPSWGDLAGQAYLFGMGPMECETTGPYFTRDQQTLFLAVQHPGEINGIRRNRATETREFALLTTNGEPLQQERSVPIGSNWPGGGENDPPKPAVVAIRRQDQRPINPA